MREIRDWISEGSRLVLEQFGRIGPVTLGFAGVIAVVYASELLVAMWAPDRLRYWFGMTQVIPTTPGWFLSIFAHAVVDRPQHYLGNLLGLILTGTIAEQHLSQRGYIGLFLMSGYLAGVSQVWVNLNIQGEATTSAVGASASVLALVGAVGVHFWRYHRAQIFAEDGGIVPVSPLVVLLVPILLVYFGGQLWGMIPQFVSDSGTVAHLVGLLYGIAYGGLQAGCDCE